MAYKLTEIGIGEVSNKGTSNEYITLHILQDTNLGDLLLFDATYAPDGSLSNIHRHLYRFKEKAVNRGDQVQLFTYKAHYSIPQFNGQRRIYPLSWEMDAPIWNDNGDRATLVRISHETGRIEK